MGRPTRSTTVKMTVPFVSVGALDPSPGTREAISVMMSATTAAAGLGELLQFIQAKTRHDELLVKMRTRLSSAYPMSAADNRFLEKTLRA